jgi:hypothetical protein
MAKTVNKSSKLKKSASRLAANKPLNVDLAALEIDPDGWPKFEKLVKSAAKMGPKPHDESKNRRRNTGARIGK